MTRGRLADPRRSRLLAVATAGLLALAILCCGHPAAFAAAPAGAGSHDAAGSHAVAGPHGVGHAPAGMPEPVAAGGQHGGDHDHGGCTMRDAGPALSTGRADPVDRVATAVVDGVAPGPASTRALAIRVKGPPPGGTGRDLLHRLSVLRT